MLHHIQYSDEKLRTSDLAGNRNDQKLRELRATHARYRCEYCQEWKADTRARRTITQGTRYLSNLCGGCADAAPAHGAWGSPPAAGAGRNSRQLANSTLPNTI